MSRNEQNFKEKIQRLSLKSSISLWRVINMILIKIFMSKFIKYLNKAYNQLKTNITEYFIIYLKIKNKR